MSCEFEDISIVWSNNFRWAHTDLEVNTKWVSQAFKVASGHSVVVALNVLSKSLNFWTVTSSKLWWCWAVFAAWSSLKDLICCIYISSFGCLRCASSLKKGAFVTSNGELELYAFACLLSFCYETSFIASSFVPCGFSYWECGNSGTESSSFWAASSSSKLRFIAIILATSFSSFVFAFLDFVHVPVMLEFMSTYFRNNTDLLIA
jgi:hypothetical protein